MQCISIDLNALINLFQFTISFSNTRACFFSALIYFSVHKYIFQCTNTFFQCTNMFSVHKYIFQCTNVFFSAQICFSVHEFIFQCTNNYVTGYDGGQVTIVFSRLTNGLPFCLTKTITTRPEGLINSILESLFCPQGELVPRGLLLLC